MTMSKSLVLLAAVAVAIACCSADKDLTPEKLQKSFAKLNKYLEKNVIQTTNPETLIGRAFDLLHEKTSHKSIFGESSMVEPLRLLRRFKELSMWSATCGTQRGRKVMEEVDAGLDDESRKTNFNYPLTKVDLIVEHYAFEYARHCGVTVRARMNYGYKQLAYDHLDTYLQSNLPETKDVAANMAKAEELMGRLKPADGALAQATRQFLDLKSTLSADTCNERGYELLLRNDLGTSLNGHTYQSEPTRRVDQIFQHYAREHAEMCRPILKKNLVAKIAELDTSTYRSVLGMIGAHYQSSDDKLEELVNLVERRPVSGDFQVMAQPEAMDSLHEGQVLLEPVNEINNQRLLNYVRAASKNDPKRKYLDEVEDKKVMDQYLERDDLFSKIGELSNSYVLEPCQKFLVVMGPLVDADKYSAFQVVDYLSSDKAKFNEELNYQLIHAASQFCKLNINDPNIIYKAYNSWFDKHYKIEKEPKFDDMEYIRNNINYRRSY